MNLKTEFPFPTREIEHSLIPMSDGAKLSARMWIPTDAEQNPVPAILTYYPYRKSDSILPGLTLILPYLAGHGYAAVCLDARGTGESDGLIADEYATQEIDDSVEAIAWLADQPWCTGAVGMWGLSWGGQNTILTAARRPPALRAVISLGSTDDSYSDDSEYMGGCVLGAQFIWTTSVHALMAQPPQPTLVGDQWRAMWLERIDKMASFLEYKLIHQRRDEYWKRSSVGENYQAINCPVYLISGWADGYVNIVPRFLSNFSGPKKGLIGPWAHGFPHTGGPGPAIGFLQECLRWWDHWLKNVETGIMNEPVLRAWINDSVEPSSAYDERPGRWVSERSWPSPRVESHELFLNEGTLDEGARPEVSLAHQSPLHVGLRSGPWLVGARSPDFPPDQREDDALSLTFDSAPLAAPLDLLGQPTVTLAVSANRPNALVAVRLCDVAPSGASLLICRGLLNLTHRASDEHPTALEPGKRYDVTVALLAVGQTVPAGHKLRLAISTSYWPFAWPSPEPATITIYTGSASRLTLPILGPHPEHEQLAPFAEPETAPPLAMESLRSFKHTWTTEHDLTSGLFETAYRTDGGLDRFKESGIEYGFEGHTSYTIIEGDPLSARARNDRVITIARGDWNTRVEARSVVTADATTFRVTMDVEGYEGNTRVASRSWNLVIPRDLV